MSSKKKWKVLSAIAFCVITLIYIKQQRVVSMYKNKNSISQKFETQENNSSIILWWKRFLFQTFTMLPVQYEKTFENPKSSSVCGTKNLLNPWHHSKIKQSTDMIFFVKTAPEKSKFRQLVRNSWGKIKSFRGKKFSTIFVVARKNDSIQQNLNNENNLYGDMLQCDFEDTYHNLPLKVSEGSGFHYTEKQTFYCKKTTVLSFFS